MIEIPAPATPSTPTEQMDVDAPLSETQPIVPAASSDLNDIPTPAAQDDDVISIPTPAVVSAPSPSPNSSTSVLDKPTENDNGTNTLTQDVIPTPSEPASVNAAAVVTASSYPTGITPAAAISSATIPFRSLNSRVNKLVDTNQAITLVYDRATMPQWLRDAVKHLTGLSNTPEWMKLIQELLKHEERLGHTSGVSHFFFAIQI